MRIATLTPTRGDRPELLDFCYVQLCSQTVQPEFPIVINFEPKSEAVDLTWRVRWGYEIALGAGMDWIVIMEDDDSYQPDHIERYARYMDRYDFIGDPNSIYYNIRTRKYQTIHHPRRASLYTTAFRVEALKKFPWPSDNHVFLDLKLWQYAHLKNKRCKFLDSGAVGIKGHGFGKKGGKGHTMNLKQDDADGYFLKGKVGADNFEFYNNLIKA